MLWCLFVFFCSWGKCTDVIRITCLVMRVTFCQARVSRGDCVGSVLNRGILRNVNPREERGSKTKLLPATVNLIEMKHIRFVQ